MESVSKLSSESVGSRLVRILFTPSTPTRRNATVESRRRCVLGSRRWIEVKVSRAACCVSSLLVEYMPSQTAHLSPTDISRFAHRAASVGEPRGLISLPAQRN